MALERVKYYLWDSNLVAKYFTIRSVRSLSTLSLSPGFREEDTLWGSPVSIVGVADNIHSQRSMLCGAHADV